MTEPSRYPAVIAALKRGTARRLGLRPPTPRLILRDILLGVVEVEEFRRQLGLAVANGRPRVIP